MVNTMSLSPAATPTAQVLVNNGRNNQTLVALFDSGAQKTFISKEAVESLNLKEVGKVSMAIDGFLSNKKLQTYAVVRPVIRLGRYKCKVTAVVKDDMNTRIVNKGLKETAEFLKQKGVKLAHDIQSDTIGPIQLIIGSDYYGRYLRRLVVKHGIQLITSTGGHLIMGNLPKPTYTHNTNNNVERGSVFMTPAQSLMIARIGAEMVPNQIAEILEEEQEPVHKLWDLDTIGIDASNPIPEDILTQNHFLNTVEYKDGQYWVGLPWKLNCPELPSNYYQARGHLKNLLHKLKQKPGQLAIYNNIIEDQLQKGFIEEVPNPGNTKLGHYLPHMAVAKDSTTTPVRVVFNCSARATKDQASLNDCLYVGPNLTENLGNVLLNFRTQKYGFVADISKAFLRIGLKERDRDFTKFLWPQDPFVSDGPLREYRFKSVLFGSCSSPFLLCSTLKYHFQNSDRPEIGHMFYMDNLQGVIDNEEKLLDIYQFAREECKKANMPLQSWNTNSPQLLQRIRDDYTDYETPTIQNVLGLQWNTNTDSLNLKPVTYQEEPLTKRTLLSQVSMLFDPLGLMSPITIKGRILVQEAWREKLDWDTPLPAKFVEEWGKLKKEYEQASTVQFPRRFDPEDINNIQLHIFCDASSKAFGAVAYLVTDNQVNLIMSKSRVTPLKERTLPQLELTAIELGTRLANYLNSKFSEIQETYIWTDSEICLHWIAKDDSHIAYVKNRVYKIKELQNNYKFNHVQSKDNPADLLSRGVNIKKLVQSTLWFNGPNWLILKDWPEQKNYEGCKEEPKLSAVPVDVQEPNAIDITRFSSLGKLLSISKLVFKFLAKKVKFQEPDALLYWVKQMQQEYYEEELKQLNKPNPKPTKLMKDLGLYLDNGIIRCRGRIGRADLPLITRFPILIHKMSHLAKLLINDAHEQMKHGGVGDTLAHLRNKYWLPQGRQTVKRYLKQCVLCLRYGAQTLKYPGPPVLPADRVARRVPFEVTGVDYTGAITITGDEGPPKKVYVCLFTCTYTRAIHLELAEDMSSETFINIFRRFAARRSCPKCLISDNGSNFVGSAPLLTEIMESPTVQDVLRTRNCVWKFTTPRAPWQNGFTERMIGIVKSCLRKVLHKRKVSLDELRTIIVEVETRVNNRPLTYLDDSTVNIEALTPSHLIHGRRINPMPNLDMEEEVQDPDLEDLTLELRRKYQFLNKILNEWDKQWSVNYLLSLRENYYGARPASRDSNPKVGEVYILKTEQPKSQWPLAKVVEVMPDREGVIRAVKVLARGQETLRTLDRLIPLELSIEERREVPQAIPPSSNESNNEGRPTRATAIQSRDRWRDLISAGHIT